MHKTWIELSSDAFFYNITQIKNLISQEYLAVVLKANAYGHGVIQIGLLVDQSHYIDYICVAFLSEALELRQAGIIKPILILSYCDEDVRYAVNKNIAFVVDDYTQVYVLQQIAQRNNTIFNVHIKIDTGLTRRGVISSQALTFITELQKLSYIRVVGLCSHFASAYDPDSILTHNQMHAFIFLIQQLKQHNIHIPLVHMANSSCINIPGCTMVRTGIAVYGYTPITFDVIFRPVLTLKTRIVQIKNVPAKTLVGYDALYCTTRDTRLALLPMGYVDGYDTRFTNNGIMYVRGCYATVCGRVAMNMTTIDVTDIPAVTVGDEVTVLGDIEGVRAFELCERAGIRNIRELLTRLNPTLPRNIV